MVVNEQQTSTSAAALDLFLADEAATEQFGALLMQAIRQVGGGMTLYLAGELGAGKTTLSRGLIRGAGHTGAVKSPTYTLVEPYSHLVPPVYHFDLYRLGEAEELEFMGIRDYLIETAVCLVEWPQRGEGVLPAADATLELQPESDGRRVRVKAVSPRGHEMISRVEGQIKPGWIAS
jgi:tRNA threonylcarbamoyladenosine biosynthesis protein TsaE